MFFIKHKTSKTQKITTCTIEHRLIIIGIQPYRSKKNSASCNNLCFVPTCIWKPAWMWAENECQTLKQYKYGNKSIQPDYPRRERKYGLYQAPGPLGCERDATDHRLKLIKLYRDNGLPPFHSVKDKYWYTQKDVDTFMQRTAVQ